MLFCFSHGCRTSTKIHRDCRHVSVCALTVGRSFGDSLSSSNLHPHSWTQFCRSGGFTASSHKFSTTASAPAPPRTTKRKAPPALCRIVCLVLFFTHRQWHRKIDACKASCSPWSFLFERGTRFLLQPFIATTIRRFDRFLRHFVPLPTAGNLLQAPSPKGQPLLFSWIFLLGPRKGTTRLF